jgi:hypothetical protein
MEDRMSDTERKESTAVVEIPDPQTSDQDEVLFNPRLLSVVPADLAKILSDLEASE